MSVLKLLLELSNQIDGFILTIDPFTLSENMRRFNNNC